MGVVDDDDFRAVEKGISVEQVAVGGDGDAIGVFVGGPRVRREALGLTDKRLDGQAVFGRCLPDHLRHELSRRAQVDDAFAIFSPAPLRQQQADQSLAASCRQLQRDVGCGCRLGDVGAQDLSLVIEQTRMLAPRQIAKQAVRAVGDRALSGRFFECHLECETVTELREQRVGRERATAAVASGRVNIGALSPRKALQDRPPGGSRGEGAKNT